MIELESLLGKFRETAERAESVIVDGFVRAEDRASPTEFIIGSEIALHLIEKAKPPVIYFLKQVLDFAVFVDDAIEEICDDDDLEAINLIRAAAKPLKPHDGKIGRFSVHFFIGSALHTIVESADWLDNFEDELETIESEVEMRSGLIRSAEEKAASVHLNALAKKLVTEPAFSYGRTSFAKRLLLAKQMFPLEPDNGLNQAVTIAEGLHWLGQSGYKGS